MHSDDWIPDLDDPDLEIDDLIEQITVDAHGDEGYWSFRQAFEDHVDFPIVVSVIGTETTIIEVDFDGDERRGLTATVERQGRAWTVGVLDVEDPDHHLRFTRLAHAYRRWLGVSR